MYGDVSATTRYHGNSINYNARSNCYLAGMAMLAPLHVTTVTVSTVTLDLTVAYIATLVYILYYIYLCPAVGLITLPILSAMVRKYVHRVTRHRNLVEQCQEEEVQVFFFLYLPEQLSVKLFSSKTMLKK